MTAVIGISSLHITTCVMCKLYIKFIYFSGLFLLWNEFRSIATTKAIKANNALCVSFSKQPSSSEKLTNAPGASVKPSAQTSSSNSSSASSKVPLHKWIALLEYYCDKTEQPVFVLSANGSILCSLCTKQLCHGERGHGRFKYSRDAVFPDKAVKLGEHITDDRHKNAVSKELALHTSKNE